MQTPEATASLPSFRKGIRCTKALHPLTRALRAVRCTVRFSTLSCTYYFEDDEAYQIEVGQSLRARSPRLASSLAMDPGMAICRLHGTVHVL